MSICHLGINDKVIGEEVYIDIADNHPLLQLSNALPWNEMADMVQPELEATTAKGK